MPSGRGSRYAFWTPTSRASAGAGRASSASTRSPLAIDVFGCGLLHKQEPKVYPAPLADWATGGSDYITFNKTKANYLLKCAELGVGQTDLTKVDVQEVTA